MCNEMLQQCIIKQHNVGDYFRAMNTRIAYSQLMIQIGFQGIAILSAKLIPKYKIDKTNFINYIS